MKTYLGGNARTAAILANLLLGMLLAGCAQQTTVSRQGPVLYPPLPSQPRLQFLMAFSSPEDFDQNKSTSFREFVVGSDIESSVRLGRPFALSHTPGMVYVLDKGRPAVISINLESGDFRTISDPRAGNLVNPTSIFVDLDDHLYIVDSARKEVIVHNQRNEFEVSYSTGDDSQPIDIVATKTEIFVSDMKNNEIIIMDKATGDRTGFIGGVGEDEGLFRKPSHLAIDPQGNIAAVDLLNNRIQLFDNKGEFVRRYGEIGRGPGAVVQPKGLDFDHAGHFYVPDTGFEFVTIFDVETTAPLMIFGKTGRGGGKLYMPVDVHIDYDNVSYFEKYADPNFELEYLVYVANSIQYVSVYGFGTWHGPLRPPRRQPEPQLEEQESSVRGIEDIDEEEMQLD